MSGHMAMMTGATIKKIPIMVFIVVLFFLFL